MKKLFYLWFVLICTNICVVTAQVNEIAFVESNFFAEERASFSRDMTYVPFDLVDGKILVNAQLDGSLKTFMLDTGAPGLVLNKKSSDNNSIEGQGITGKIDISEETVQYFEWAGIEAKETEALVVNLSHLESAAQQDLAGLIGYDILKNAEVLFDYKRRLIILTKNNKSSWHTDQKPKAIIDFKMHGHLPVIKAKIGKRIVYLGLDSGAETNILDDKMLKKLNKSLIINSQKEKIVGLDKNEKSAKVAWISETNIKKDVYSNMKYLFTDLSVINNSDTIQIDGLLGAPFFQSIVFSINYEKQKLYVW